MEKLIDIENLSIAFQQNGIDSIALKPSSFFIEKGKIVAVVGESGSGKSITALSILGLLSKETKISGKIIFNQEGEKIDLLNASEKDLLKIRGKEISMIFQEPMTSLNPAYTVGNQVSEAIQWHLKLNKNEAKKKTIELFEAVELPTPELTFKKFPHQLSGGQKQRVMIAMSMSCNPKLLIADEPTTALDVSVQKSIIRLLQKFQKEKDLSILFITHDLALVADIADEIVVMYKGEIVEQGNAKQVLNQPKHAYTKALLACKPTPDTKGKKLLTLSETMQGIEIKQENISKLPIGKTILEVKNVSVHFPIKKNLFGKPTEFFKAVNDVSFSVLENETIGLVGESGCGKTTLGRAILQLIPITKGEILLHGENISSLSKKQLVEKRKELQIVFQDPYGSLNPRLTIESAITEPMLVHKILDSKKSRVDKAAELLEKTNLNPDLLKRYPHQLSGGQRQRICIARSLALEPNFLVFDESVSALDVSVQAQVLNLIQELKYEFKFSSIFISHDLNVIHYISDRIVVMRAGSIVEQGLPDEIFHHPKTAYTKMLLDAIPGKINN